MVVVRSQRASLTGTRMWMRALPSSESDSRRTRPIGNPAKVRSMPGAHAVGVVGDQRQALEVLEHAARVEHVADERHRDHARDREQDADLDAEALRHVTAALARGIPVCLSMLRRI